MIDSETLFVVPDSGIPLTDELSPGGRLGVHPLEVGFPARVARWPLGRRKPRIRTTRARNELGRRRERWLPVEHVGADHDSGPCHRTGLEQLVFDAQLGQAVGQVTDRLLVGEVALRDPAFRLCADDAVNVAEGPALDDNIETQRR